MLVTCALALPPAAIAAKARHHRAHATARPSTVAHKPKSASASKAETGGAAKPLYGAAGFDAAGQDKSTRPGDDFFRYANGAWLDRTPIPPDLPSYSLRRAMTDRTEQRIHEMMEHEAAIAPHAPETLEGKIGAFYKSFMNDALVDALGAKPLASTLEQIRGAKTRAELAGLMGRTNSDFES